MYERLFIGKKNVELDETESTNTYLQHLISNNEKEVEGLVVAAENQYSGKGQRGNSWHSERGKNLTFSIFLKPNVKVKNQFLISKSISLGIVDFLLNRGLNNVKIKWPNDIYCDNKKLAGILIENSVRGDKIYASIVGIGLNVNQIKFLSSLPNPTSLSNVLGIREIDISEALNELLFFIEKQYISLKEGKAELINAKYLKYLYWLNETKKFSINKKNVEGIIIGISPIGKLQVEIKGEVEEFGLKEIEFLE